MRLRRNIQHCLLPVLISALGLRGSVGAFPVRLLAATVSGVDKSCHLYISEGGNDFDHFNNIHGAANCGSDTTDTGTVKADYQRSYTVNARQLPRNGGAETDSGPRGLASGNPAQIAFITLGLIVFIVVLAFIAMRFYLKKKRSSSNQPQWPPMDAPSVERQQLIDLIRIGIIDSRGAPIHVLNWVLYGPDAPWPPPDNVTQLWASRRRARRRRRRRAQGEGTRSNAQSGSGSGTRSRNRRTRRTSMEELAPLPPYVKEANEDENHYPIPEYQHPPEFLDPIPSITAAPVTGSLSETEGGIQLANMHPHHDAHVPTVTETSESASFPLRVEREELQQRERLPSRQ